MCPSERAGYRVVRTWVVPARAIAQVRLSPGRLAAIAVDFDHVPEVMHAIRLGRAVRSISLQNIVFSVLVLSILIPGALLGAVTVVSP